MAGDAAPRAERRARVRDGRRGAGGRRAFAPSVAVAHTSQTSGEEGVNDAEVVEDLHTPAGQLRVGSEGRGHDGAQGADEMMRLRTCRSQSVPRACHSLIVT